MLHPHTVAIIKATAPVLEQHGTAVTTLFYRQMFEAHPELLNIFNDANQRQGRQQAALANSLYAAAVHIDKLESILPVVQQIAHKHRSLGVRAEHYPIVGQYLLAAMKEVLGDAATPEILGAWGEAYGVIANVFISVEKGLYEAAEAQPGGWRDFRPFRVQRRVKESEAITSFYLVPAHGGPLSPYRAGQYISVKLQISGEPYTHIRQYSLSDAGGKGYYRLSVKREDAAEKREQGIVSNYLHAHVNEGDELLLSAPAGDFVLDGASTRPVVLLSGGVGLTPLLSMLHTLAEQQPERPVTFVHAAISGEHHALRDEVEALVAGRPNMRAYFVYDRPTEADTEAKAYHQRGFIEREWLRSVLGGGEEAAAADYYFCGPLPFMKAVFAVLKSWGVPPGQMHYELFGPATSLDQPAPAAPCGSAA